MESGNKIVSFLDPTLVPNSRLEIILVQRGLNHARGGAISGLMLICTVYKLPEAYMMASTREAKSRT